MAGGAPIGNKNASKGRPWTDAIQRALTKRSKLDQKEALDELAMKLIDLGLAGDLDALKELGNRLEGKVAQGLVLSQDPENPLFETVRKAEELRAQLRGMPVGHRTDENHPQYIEPASTGIVPEAQRTEQVEPE